MKRLLALLLGLSGMTASAQLRIETIPSHRAASEPAPSVCDSLVNIRPSADPDRYRCLVGQRILFFPRDPQAFLWSTAYGNFLADEPSVVGVDTVWLRKRRNKVRPGDFRLDTLYSDLYRPRFFRNEQVAVLGCSLSECRGLGTIDFSAFRQNGWFTPAEAIEGRSFEIRGVEKRKIDDYELLLFRLRDPEGNMCNWFAHAGQKTVSGREAFYPAVLEGLVERYRTALVGKSHFLTGRKPDVPGFVSPYSGLMVKTLQGEDDRLLYGTELRCKEMRWIGDGSDYAVPSLVFERVADSVELYVPLTRYPDPFGFESIRRERPELAFVDELTFTPAEVVYAQRAEEARRIEEERVRNEREQREREAAIRRKYGQSIARLILNRQVQVGMTRDMCREAWGAPDDINRTTGIWGVHEQWVYGSGSYLYFEDGILTSIQN